ncbi:MAG: PASTA domain-containing protein, partial [Ruminococcus sp.]
EKKLSKSKKTTLIAALISMVVFVGIGILLVATDCFGLIDTNQGGIEETTTTAPWKGETVDNFVGKKYSSVAKDLENSDKYILNVNYEEKFNDKVEEGYICEQTPAPGTPITSEGDPVNISITISKGKKMRTLPDISGKDIKTAASLLADAGVLVMQEAEYSAKYPDKTVIEYKDLKAGDQIEYGKTVTIRVSMGEEPTSEESTNG